ncbi:hypothetical protein FFLO_04818 [Filobasidium floriforme]|uniref:Transcription factor tau subunit sfc1 n=1 Tax=Filobasidium floriforme TaxID=5210 RepID=A0A8K0NRY0_9TREE|nr:hypothetical protein FFLO_04818 [Filobasidium floriforme]
MQEEDKAPFYPIGHEAFQSVEYPGPIGPSSASLDKALRGLGRPEDWNSVFNKSRSNLELRFRPDDHFAHPVAGDRTTTHRVLLKVTRRRRRRSNQAGEDDVHSEGGIYKIELPGTIKQTVRYRAMADYQYKPSPESRTVRLIDGLIKADYETLSTFEFAPLDEEYDEPLPTGHPIGLDDDPASNGDAVVGTGSQDKNKQGQMDWDGKITRRSRLHALPPPQFSTQSIPARFAFEHGPMSKLEPYTNPIKGDEGFRYVNRHKNVVHNFRQIRHADQGIPQEPAADIKTALKQPHTNAVVLETVKKHFQERPVWSRLAIHNQFDAEIRRLFQSKHAYLPAVAYVIVDGPFRDNLVRLGFDPRTDRSTYKYQRMYFRIMREDGGARMSMNKIQESNGELQAPRTTAWQADRMKQLYGQDFEPDVTKSHLFDGKVLHRDVGNFQLCDISEPLLESMIHNPRALSDRLDDTTGWYKPRQFHAIKAMLRLKWQALIDGKECDAEKIEELVAQFNDFDNNTLPQGYENDDGGSILPLSANTAPKKRTRKSRAKQSALDEQGLAAGSRTYRGPLSDAAQQEQRLRGANLRESRMANVTMGREPESELGYATSNMGDMGDMEDE